MSNKKKKNKIFVQIASYRDSELIPTINNLLENAKTPDNIVLCICRQYHPDDKFDNLTKFKDDNRFKIIDVLYNETKGVCWARNQMQQLWDGEEYTLHLDSHHRFVKFWDQELITMVKNLKKEGYNKPLLTAYLPSYDPHNDPNARATEPWQMVFDRFIPEGAVFFKPEAVKDWKNRILPVRARFFSAHFCFTLGEFCKEVPHNPNYLFHGEEISIAARAYTWGYDLFHPHKVVCYHEYSRSYRKQVWGDDSNWNEKNIKSHLINRKLFGMDGLTQEGHDGEYGFGKERSLRDYEIYAGILFKKRAIQKYTLDNEYPPNPKISDEKIWEKTFLNIYKHCIDINYSDVPEKDYEFWVVAFHDENDETIYRKDASKDEIDRMMNDPDKYAKVWREFQAEKLPKYWVVWPYSTSKGWCDRIIGNLI